MGYPQRLLTDGEEIIREFRPHWRLLVIPLGWSLIMIAVVVLTWAFPPDVDILDFVITAAAIVGLMVLGIYPLISWWFTGYILTTERLITRRGVLARKGLEIPLENVNDVSFSQTIFERLLRSGDLLIESAGMQGQSRFSNIPNPEAFQSLLYRVRETRSKELSGSTVPDAPADDISKIERLGRLLSEGLITREEFETRKDSILDEEEAGPDAG